MSRGGAVAWIVTGTFAAILLLLAVPRPAAALCDGMLYDGTAPIDVPDAVIFVGTVVETQSSQQNALLRVEEVWQGGPLPEWQAVYGVTEANVIVSASTHLEVGQPYLVVATRNGHLLMNHGCRTNRYSDTLAVRAPDDATGPTSATRPGTWGNPEPTPWWILLGIGTAAVTVAAAWGTLMLRRDGED
jgi:hypothetical protein